MSLDQAKIKSIKIFKTKYEIICVGWESKANNRYWVLIINRSVSSLVTLDSLDNTYFTNEQINQLLVQHGINVNHKNVDVVRACGIIGFIRFLNGFHMIVITKYDFVGVIGGEKIFKIATIDYLYVNNSNIVQSEREKKYERLFKSIDLSSHFYFSHDYDLTNSYQYNTTRGKVKKMSKKFIWNNFLLKNFKVDDLWKINLIHGFYREYRLLIYGMCVSVAVLARRSARFVGTRYHRRGCNTRGNVANEVEIEQIVTDLSKTSPNGAKITSFVQIRGSCPLVWRQEYHNVGKRPPITLLRSDPQFVITSIHYNKLLHRFGTPLIVLDLLRKNPKSDEFQLTEENKSAIRYLNQFLPPQFCIEFIQFDIKGTPHVEVLRRLRLAAKNIVNRTGIFWKEQRQCGVVRTYCVDCLDRTNIAQFAIGRFVLEKQLYNLFLIPSHKMRYESIYSTTLEKLYDEMGDALALQYAGSCLVHYINHYYSQTDIISAATDIIPNISRYYSNTFIDKRKQAALDIFLGKDRPHGDSNALYSSDEDSSDEYRRALTISDETFPHNSDEITGKFYYDSAWFDRSMLNFFPRSPHEMRTEEIDQNDINRGKLVSLKKLSELPMVTFLRLVPNTAETYSRRCSILETKPFYLSPDLRRTVVDPLQTKESDLEIYKAYVKSQTTVPVFDNCEIMRRIHTSFVVPNIGDKLSSVGGEDFKVDGETFKVYKQYLSNNIINGH